MLVIDWNIFKRILMIIEFMPSLLVVAGEEKREKRRERANEREKEHAETELEY